MPGESRADPIGVILFGVLGLALIAGAGVYVADRGIGNPKLDCPVCQTELLGCYELCIEAAPEHNVRACLVDCQEVRKEKEDGKD